MFYAGPQEDIEEYQNSVTVIAAFLHKHVK